MLEVTTFYQYLSGRDNLAAIVTAVLDQSPDFEVLVVDDNSPDGTGQIADQMAEAQPEILARHWTYSGDAEPAIAAWKRAGEAAEARRAFREAEEGYRQAFSAFDVKAEIVHGHPLSAVLVAWRLIYAVVYCLVCLGAAVVVFARREFK